MAFCEQCGKEIEEGKVLCDECGKNKSRKPNKLLIIILSFVAVVLSVAIVLIFTIGGSCKSAINGIERTNNFTASSPKEYISDTTNGYLERELNSILKIVSSADKEFDNAFLEIIKEAREDIDNTYGEDAEVSFKIKEEKELSDDSLNYAKGELTDLADVIGNVVDYLKEFPDEVTEKLGIEQDDLDDMVETLEKMQVKLNGANVTEGYEVTCEVTTKGSLSENTESTSYEVYKIDGRWVHVPGVYTAFSMLYSLAYN